MRNLKANRMAVLAFLILWAGEPARADELALDLGAQGILALDMPQGWSSEIRPSGRGAMPTASLTAEGSDRFVVLVTPFWAEVGAAPDFDTDAGVCRIVETGAAEVAPNAVEEQLTIEPIGGGRTGYMYLATDKSLVGRTVPPGQYLYMRQGALMVGKLLCAFTILTNETPSPDSEKALKLLRNAADREGA